MTERAALDAVLFDAGGTLVRLDFEWMSEALREIGAPIDAATLRHAEVSGRRRYDARRGQAVAPIDAAPDRVASVDHATPRAAGAWGEIREYFGGMLESAGVPPLLLDPALERFWLRDHERGLWARPMEGARAAIEGCAELGLKSAVVSNSDGRAEQHLIACGVREGIEFVVDSHHVGIEKPDPGIVRMALERLRIPAERALFVGDIRSVDEAVARAAGTHFVLIDPYGDYASAGTPSISGMDRLTAWVAARFDVSHPSRADSRGS